MLYSKTITVKGRTSSQLERGLDSKVSASELVRDPRLHAKLLAWDEDALVVTSQNWMSRDPGFSKYSQQLGVCQ